MSELPSDWSLTPVSALAARAPNALATGPFGSSVSSTHFRNQGVPLIRGGNLSARTTERLKEEDWVYLSPAKAAEFARSTVRPGDLVFTCWGTINQVGLITDSASHPEYVISNKQMKLTPDLGTADPLFLYFQFSGPELQREILQGSIGSSIPGFNLTRLRQIRIPLPPLREQKRIAEALSDADELIVGLERLIAKKQAIKLGMMQQLLTGQTRLPGFTEKWRTVDLGELGAFIKGTGIKRDDVRRSGVPCIRYGEIYTRYRNYTSETASFVGERVASEALPIRFGDILFAGSGETRDEIGLCIAFIGRESAVAGGDIVILRGRDFNPVFLACAANTPGVASQKARLGQGDAVVHISGRALASIEIDLPQKQEQDAIAEVVLDVDAEIDLLTERLVKARAVKQGMMQELLTGRTRLGVAEGAE